MRKTIASYLISVILLSFTGSAYASLVPSFDYLGNWSLSDPGGDGFYEKITLSNPFGSGAGAVTHVYPSSDGLLGDQGEYIGTANGGTIMLTLDSKNVQSGVSYAFDPATYYHSAGDGFALFDDNGILLFAANLTVTEMVIDNSTGAINSMFDLNLSDIVAGADYWIGTSTIVDAFLSAPGGAANFTLNIGGNIAAAIEGAGGSGTYSGSASVVPIPATLPLLFSALGMLGLIKWRGRSNA